MADFSHIDTHRNIILADAHLDAALQLANFRPKADLEEPLGDSASAKQFRRSAARRALIFGVFRPKPGFCPAPSTTRARPTPQPTAIHGIYGSYGNFEKLVRPSGVPYPRRIITGPGTTS